MEGETVNIIRAEGVLCGKMIVFIAMRGAAATCPRARPSEPEIDTLHRPAVSGASSGSLLVSKPGSFPASAEGGSQPADRPAFAPARRRATSQSHHLRLLAGLIFPRLARTRFVVQGVFPAALTLRRPSPPQRRTAQVQHLANRRLRDPLIQRHQNMCAVDLSHRMHSLATKRVQSTPIRLGQMQLCLSHAAIINVSILHCQCTRPMVPVITVHRGLAPPECTSLLDTPSQEACPTGMRSSEGAPQRRVVGQQNQRRKQALLGSVAGLRAPLVRDRLELVLLLLLLLLAPHDDDHHAQNGKNCASNLHCDFRCHLAISSKS